MQATLPQRIKLLLVALPLVLSLGLFAANDDDNGCGSSDYKKDKPWREDPNYPYRKPW